MPIFAEDSRAWSLWTRSVELFAGDPKPPVIVQANSIMRPLYCATGTTQLNTFRKLLVGDSLPAYCPLNMGVYTGTSTRVSDGYDQYLQQLNGLLRRKYPDADEKVIERLLKRFRKAQERLQEFLEESRRRWKRAKEQDPSLSRQDWEVTTGYPYERQVREEAAADAWGEYRAEINAYPDLARVAKALRALYDPRARIPLPMAESEVGDPHVWSDFLKTYLDGDIAAFLSTDNNSVLHIDQSTSTSTHFETRWSGSASVGYGFWGFGGGASGGTVDHHIRQESLAVRVSFRNLVKLPVVRGPWFDHGLVQAYHRLVDTAEYWGPSGVLSLVPQEVILGRGVSIDIDTRQTSYDYFRNWYQASASGGFSLGPFRFGASGASASDFQSIRNSSQGTTIRIEDTSNTIYVVGVVSLKINELSSLSLFRNYAAEDAREFALLDETWRLSTGLHLS